MESKIKPLPESRAISLCIGTFGPPFHQSCCFDLIIKASFFAYSWLWGCPRICSRGAQAQSFIICGFSLGNWNYFEHCPLCGIEMLFCTLSTGKTSSEDSESFGETRASLIDKSHTDLRRQAYSSRGWNAWALVETGILKGNVESCFFCSKGKNPMQNCNFKLSTVHGIHDNYLFKSTSFSWFVDYL